tara:strand:+ start:3593 stop:4060 length:468 start_codon:yes stop_codon:yes gene_type:complete
MVNKMNEIMKIKNRMEVLSSEYERLEGEMEKLLNEDWVKNDECTICCSKGETEWHHIISQHRCKEAGLEYLIKLRGNVVELCKTCHDLTTASMLRKNMEGKSKVSEDNEGLEPTEKQLNYIKKLGGVAKDGLTRKGASLFIDELKNLKGDPTQTT